MKRKQNQSVTHNQNQFFKRTHISGLVVLAIMASTAQAGKITSMPSASGAEGFGGWNEDNVEIVVNEGSYNPADGSYTYDVASDGSFVGLVNDGAGTVTGVSLGKDWPVGEPPGIKVINDDLNVKAPKPPNCIMTTSYLDGHYLDTADPMQVPCSGPFQAHKRYKVGMLPSSIDGIGTDAIDLVFNVESEAGSRSYQVYQKINNWTNSRLQGYKVQIGTGVGANFQTASEAGIALENLNISIPAEIWPIGAEVAVFSIGLFGAPDDKHPSTGYFDPTQRAGFFVAEHGQAELTDTLTSAGQFGSDYLTGVPADTAGTTAQFGPWLPDSMLPYGIFFDDDGNPETDAALMAWYGYNPEISALGWMSGSHGLEGDATPFQEIPAADITTMGENLAFTMGEIDDLVNVGLDYIITIGDTANIGSTITLRVIPDADTSGTPAPPYVGADGHPVLPVPELVFTSSDASVLLDPNPEFVIDGLLTARVGDADLNVDPLVLEEVDVTVASGTMSATVTLVEQGENRGVFVGALPDEFSAVAAGTVVTMTYVDANDGTGATVTKTSSSTAVEAAPVVDVTVDSVDVPATIKSGGKAEVGATLTNNGADAVTATVTMSNDAGDTFTADVAMDAGTGSEVEFDWRAPRVHPRDPALTVTWTVDVAVDGTSVASATATTVVGGTQGNSDK